MSTPPFEFGQTIYIARAGAWNAKRVPCPLCAATQRLTVITADGVSHLVECAYCCNGESNGYIIEHGPSSRVDVATIDGMSRSGDSWSISTPIGHIDLCDAFATHEAADARRAILLAEATARVEMSLGQRAKDAHRSTTWTLGYHRREAKSHREKAEWHESKIAELKSKKTAKESP